MAARAIWKGVVKIGSAGVPVKLYSAVQDKSIHFRLLHAKDKVPVKQQLVNPETGDPLEKEDVKKAFPVTKSAMVILEKEDLEGIEPEESRNIEVTRFVSTGEIDHRWYSRSYFLGPDAGKGSYFALAEALKRKEKEGVARWVMRKKEYVGSLREHDGYLMLIVLRHADEVIASDQLPAPQGRALDPREIRMAEQLVSALSGKFDPEEFRDEYRERVMELVEYKARGGKPKLKKFRPKPSKDESLDRALAASIASLSKRKAG